jgi:proteasome activator subunit 4
MFSKDPVCMSYAQGALRSLAMLEPNLIMPELLERAYGGLEVVNETHRTTAVLSMLSGIARPLVTEQIWLGGQKHVVPLLELCIPGIDLVRLSILTKSSEKLNLFCRTIRSRRSARQC